MVTMKDIAGEAGVSQATVSLVLNNRDSEIKISNSTRELVLKTASRLGFRKNQLACEMATGKSLSLAYFVNNISREFASGILAGASAEADRRGYSVKLFTAVNEKDFTRAINRIIEQRIAGVITRGFSPDYFEVLRNEFQKAGIPVASNQYSSADNMVFVDVNDKHGAYDAVCYLVNQGHGRIAHLTNKINEGYVIEREKGYVQAMTESGLNIPESYIYRNDDIGVIESYAFSLFSSCKGERPTAFFCASDYIAMSVIRAIRKAGLRVPEDVSVIGFGNLLMGQFSDPPMTTVEQSYEKTGEILCRLLVDKIHDKNSKNNFEKMIRPSLIIRKSVAQCRQGIP
jgi:DNA-binding LacI/PurR family transcriptional regulator